MSFGIVSGLIARSGSSLNSSRNTLLSSQLFPSFSSLLLTGASSHSFDRVEATPSSFSSQHRSFFTSPTSQMGFRKYLRDVPKPSPERQAEIDAQLAIVKQFREKRDPSLTFEMYYPALRDTYLHRGANIKMSRVAILMTKVNTPEHLSQAVKLMKHLQRGGYEFGRHVCNNFIYASIRVDQPQVALDLLHRSVSDRGNIDEEPLYRVFPAPSSYHALILAFLKKNELDNAIKAFSIAIAQHRDNPDPAPAWPLVFWAGMQCYWNKKDYAAVRLIYQEALHRKLPDLPATIGLLARVEAQKKDPSLRLLYGYRLYLEESFQICPKTLLWNEITGLIAYVANDANVVELIKPSFKDAVSRFLAKSYDPERVEALFGSTTEEI